MGVSWRLQGSARRAGDTYAAAYVLSNTGFRENNGSFALGYSLDRFSVEVYYSLYDNELGIFRGSHIGSPDDLLRAIAQGRPLNNAEFSYTISPPKQTITHDLWSVKSIVHSEVGRFEFRYGWQQNNRNEFDAHNSRLKDSTQLQAALERPAMSLELTTQSLDVQWQHKPLTIDHTTLSGKVGLSASRQSNARSGKVFLIPGFRSYSAGMYAVENYSVGNWLFNAGVRFDIRSMPVYAIENRGIPDTTLTFSGVGYAFGVLWSSAQDDDVQQNKGNWFVTANLSSTWRPPQVNEVYSNDVHHGTAQYEIGNASLQPERSFAGDVSVRYQDPSLFVEVTGFVNSIKNYIVALPDVHNPTITIRGTFPTFRFTQLQTLLRGAETRAIWHLLPELSLSSSYMIVKGTQTDNGEPLFQMPPSRLYSAIDLKIPLLSGQSVFVHAGLVYVQQQTAFMPNSDYAPPPPSYTLVDGSVGAELLVFSQPIRCSLSINNLGNIAYRDYLSRYRYFADDPGRNIIFRLSIPFGTPDQVNK